MHVEVVDQPNVGGRLVVMSYQSLEDRITKLEDKYGLTASAAVVEEVELATVEPVAATTLSGAPVNYIINVASTADAKNIRELIEREKPLAQ